MSCSLKSFVMSSSFFMLFFLPAHFNELSAEQGAWGENGGWWGGGNREWIGDFDGPGYHRSSRNCASYHSHRDNYPYYNSYGHCYNNCYNASPSSYYYDESVPGAALYFSTRCRRYR